MNADRWDPKRCNFEPRGAGLISVADWFGKSRPGPFPSESELLSRFAAKLESHPKIDILLSHKGGMGDTVMCSTVAHELRRRGVKNIWLETRWAEDFASQAVFDGVLPESFESEWLAEKLGGRIVYPSYTHSILEEDRDASPKDHILAEMCRAAGVLGEVALRPYFEPGSAPYPGLPREFIAITSVGAHGVLTKNWYLDRFQILAALLGKDLRLVQLGSLSEPLLDGVIDLRGKTDIREAAGVLRAARCFVGEVGGLMHLARAVDCPAAIVYGGRELPRQSGYAANVNVVGPVPCSPCWIIKKCPYEMKCMDLIRPADVHAAVGKLLASSPRRPLAHDLANVG
jgi:hypothetical protein